MPFNGAGSFTLVTGNPVVTGTVINSTVHNNTNNDIASGLTNCITRDGQSAPSANLPMGGFKHTGATSAAANGQYIVYGQSGASLTSLTVGGSSTKGDADQLRLDLADTASAAKGAALSGINYSLSYSAANTSAWALTQYYVLANGFPGATVTQQIDAAIAASAGRTVVIPPSMGAGEPTSFPTSVVLWDLRGANAVGAGRKFSLNLSDANGQNLVNAINDLTNPLLSNSAVLTNCRATGALPNNRNIEGIQNFASTIGTVSAGGSGFILCGSENGATVNSDGGTVGFLWGSSFTATTGGAKTTSINEIAGIRAIGVANNGTSTPVSMYSAILDDVSGNATNKGSLWSKGNALFGGNITVNRNGVSSASTFLSGAVGNFYSVLVGTDTGKVRLAAVGTAGDFFSATLAGDGVIGTSGANNLWAMVAGVGILRARSTELSTPLPIFPGKDDGTMQLTAGLFAGSGVPNNANGSNGNYYFRSDTPGTAGQRIYVKSAGVWVGIV